MRLSNWKVPIASFAGALILASLSGHPRGFALRAPGSASLPDPCHVRTEKNPVPRCESRLINVPEVPANCTEIPLPPGSVFRTYESVDESCSVEVYAGSQDPFVFKSGFKAGAIGEQLTRERREIAWHPGPKCPNPPPCHDLTGALKVNLEYSLLVTPPTVVGDFGESKADIQTYSFLRADECGRASLTLSSKTQFLTFRRTFDPILLQVVDTGQVETTTNRADTFIEQLGDVSYPLIGNTAKYFDSFEQDGLINDSHKFKAQASLDYMVTASVGLVRPPIGATGQASGKVQAKVEAMELNDVQEPSE